MIGKCIPDPDTFSSSIPTSDPISYKFTPVVEFAIREALGGKEGDLTKADLLEAKRIGLHGTAMDAAGLKASDADLKDLIEIPDLRYLSLYGSEITDTGLKELAKLKHLKELDLRFCKQLTDAGVTELIKALPGVPIDWPN